MTTMLRRTALATVAALAWSTTAHAVFDVDETTAPGKQAFFASRLESFSSAGTFGLTGTLSKGRSKRVLRVHATYLTELGVSGPGVCGIQPSTIRVAATVNGVAMRGWPGTSCPALSYDCSATGILWLDLDAAETAHPGQFKGKPLNVAVVGTDYNVPFGCIITHALTVEAVLSKK